MSAPGLRSHHDQELLDLIDDLTDRFAGPMAADITAMITQLLVLWGQGGDNGPSAAAIAKIQTTLAGMLSALPITVNTAALLDALTDAVQIGVDQATAESGLKATRATLPDDVVESVRGLPERMLLALAGAKKLLKVKGIATLGDVIAVVGVAKGALNTLKSTIATQTSTSVAAGAAAVAERSGYPRLWVPEKDACLECLKYAGLLAAPGKDFPGGLTFSSKATGSPAVATPPRHPHCRCRVTPWRGVTASAGVDYPEVLKREAERAVLRGTAISESRPARLRAADKLLKQGTNLPPTVKKRAARAVKKGAFT